MIGRTYPSTEPYLVGREKLREFAIAVHEDSAAPHDLEVARAAGHADLVAPPTYVATIAQRAEAEFLFDPESGVDFAHLVHGGEKIELARPVIAGDELVAQTTVQSIKRFAGNAIVTTSTAVSSIDGADVALVTASFVIKEQV